MIRRVSLHLYKLTGVSIMKPIGNSVESAIRDPACIFHHSILTFQPKISKKINKLIALKSLRETQISRVILGYFRLNLG